MSSPFPYETYAQDNTFFGRVNELNKLNSICSSSNNVLIHSKRRMGKTSLVKHFLSTQKDKITIYCDIFNITSPNELGNILLQALAKEQKGDIKTTIAKLAKLFKRITFGVDVDASSGDISYTPKIKELDFEQIMEELFGALFELSKTKDIIFVIDEFQQISLFKDKKIDAIFRKYMQENYNISYIFLGSKRHILYELFAYKSPLYEMATQLELDCIKLSEYQNYIKKHLDISDELVEYIYKKASCETKLIQHICHILYREYKEDTIQEEYIDSAINEIVLSKDGSYSALFDSLVISQKKALKILSKHKSGMFKNEVLFTYDISRQTLTSALNQLFKKEIIDKHDSKWFIPDRALELWMIEKL